jgi:hypothetical protein
MERDATFRDTWTKMDWLRHAAEALRRIAADATRGPWRWGDPGVAASSRERHQGTLEDLRTPSTFPTIRPPLADREPVLPGLTDPLEPLEHAIDPIAPRLAANARWIAVMSPSIAEPSQACWNP